MNTICLVVDRLHVGHVGAYGNTWIETPSLDRLAAESCVFDQAMIDSSRPENLCHAYWRGRHALTLPDSVLDPQAALPAILSQSGVTTTLFSDEPVVLGHPLATGFDEVVTLPTPPATRVAPALEETHLADSFARLIDHVETTDGPFFTWCHLRGLGAPWDAPMEFRGLYVDEEDPEPSDSAEVPSLVLPEDYDPDFLLGISQAYAGQVSLLDTCVGALLESFNSEAFGQETLLCLIGARGFPLGEHRLVGDHHDSLHAELVHVPMMLRLPDGRGATVRIPSLVQPSDLFSTLGAWHQTDLSTTRPVESLDLLPLVSEESGLSRDRSYIVGNKGDRAIRTPAWYLLDGRSAQLFAKPDDRWEVNDVANRCPEIVRLLREVLDELERSIVASDGAAPRELDATLLHGLE